MKIDLQYNQNTDDLGKCTIEVEDHQANNFLQTFQLLFSEELKQAFFSKKHGRTIIFFLAPKAKIIRLEKVICQAKKAFAQLN